MNPQTFTTQDMYKKLKELATPPPIFCFEDLERATKDFNEGYKLGSGTYGTVFKGVLKDGTPVAVKKMNNVEHAESQFLTEVTILASVKHVHLVVLRGYCIHRTFDTGITFYIVYDLLHNRSLSDWIFTQNGEGECLSWEERYRVAVEVAKALVYLHIECSPCILHLDIKPGNVLLDKDFRAVLSDFGMAMLMNNDHNEYKVVGGTRGYIPPERCLDNRLSVKLDIFSYGVVLMDLFFGESYVCLDENGEDIYEKKGNTEKELQVFHDFMLKEIRRGAIKNHIDKRMLEKNKEEVNERDVICLIRVALRCIHKNPKMRPGSMEEVVNILARKNADETAQQARFPWVPEHFKEFISREITKTKVIEALKDNDTKRIGVYGVEGVGKTIFIKQICEEVEDTNLFTKVVFVTVSQNPDKIKIQTEIAENLGLRIDEECLPVRARILLTRLRQEKNVLIVLDNLLARLELSQLGIIPYKGKLHTCKVVILAQSLSICDLMQTTKNIQVQKLSDIDSLELFKENVGSVDFNGVHPMPEDIAKECEGLPSAILSFAWALCNKAEADWPEIINKERKDLFLGLFNDHQSTYDNQLAVLKDEIQGKVTLARNNGYSINKAVKKWLYNVDEIRDQLETLHHEAKNVKGRSACHQLCEKSKSSLATVNELLEEGGNFSSVTDPAKVPSGVMEQLYVLESRTLTKNEISEALINENLVGIYGMGGVGKTSLVNQFREVKATNLFDKVVLATVSVNHDLIGIQTQIAEAFGMELKETTLLARANRLAKALKHRKKNLIILDDLWKTLRLSEVGILPSKDCKVLITSRSLNVCGQMRTTKDIEVKVLSRKESLDLFLHVMGNADSDGKHKMCQELVDECDGLPLAIVRLAESLRIKDHNFWEAVIPELKESMYIEMGTVKNSIKASYDFLESKTRLCFLLCSLFPKQHRIHMETLIGYATGEGLLEDAYTQIDARRKLYIMVDTLVSSGLLLTDNINEWVVMHKIFRDTAISIAREGNLSIIKAGLGLDQWPKEVSTSSLRMSLMKNDVKVVPDKPKCSQLVTLSLASNMLLKKIPDHFFDDMKCLGTLDLSNTSISYFPKSVSSLKSLRSLYLDDCKLEKNISLIGKLQALEVLSLRGTGISELPKEVRSLPYLKTIYPLNLHEASNYVSK